MVSDCVLFGICKLIISPNLIIGFPGISNSAEFWDKCERKTALFLCASPTEFFSCSLTLSRILFTGYSVSDSLFPVYVGWSINLKFTFKNLKGKKFKDFLN